MKFVFTLFQFTIAFYLGRLQAKLECLNNVQTARVEEESNNFRLEEWWNMFSFPLNGEQFAEFEIYLTSNEVKRNRFVSSFDILHSSKYFFNKYAAKRLHIAFIYYGRIVPKLSYLQTMSKIFFMRISACF